MPTKSKSKKIKHLKKARNNNSDLMRKIVFLLILLALSIFIVKTITDEQAKGKINVSVDSHEYDRDDNRTGGTDHKDNGNNKFPRTSATSSPSGQPNPSVTVNNVQSQGAYLQFDPATTTLNVGDEFDAKVVVNTGGKQVLSSEAYVLFNNTYLQVVSVQDGTLFPVTNYTTSGNSIVIRGLVNEPAAYREGIGILATVKFKAIQNGISQLTAYCNLQAGNTSKIIQNNIDAQNIIDCAGNQLATINIGNVAASITITHVPPGLTHKPTKKPLPSQVPFDDKKIKIMVAMILIIFVILIMILGI